jgi:flagellar biosynthesis/type III secretory pathway protein FliH
MGKTIAQDLEERGIQQGMQQGMQQGLERGELRGRQATLIRQLHKRFTNVPDEIVRAIEATQDIERLDDWLERILTARTLRDIGVKNSN